jgi:hypothetical protein
MHEHKYCPVCYTPGVKFNNWWYCPKHHQVPVNVHVEGIEISWEEVYDPGEGHWWIVGWGLPQAAPEFLGGDEYGCN